MTLTTARRSVSITVASLLAAGTLALGAGAARADVLGSMTVDPATGTDTSGVSLTTPGPCPAPSTNLIVSVTGSGFPAAGQNVVSNSPISTYAATPAGGIVVPLTQTMRDYASTAGFTLLQGKYDFKLTCRPAFGATTFGDYTTSIWFTSNTAYQNTAPSTAAATTTTLAVTPAGPVIQGAAVKLTATVAPAAATGTVQFMDGTAKLGTPVAVAAGSAVLTTGALTVGTHALTAKFTPADTNAYLPSASTATSFTVKVKPPVLVSAPKVTGTARVGSTVTCAVTYSGATAQAYGWLRDGATISGAKAKTFALTATDYKHKIACRTAAANSTGSVGATSPAVTVAVGPALKNGTLPSISGVVKTGQRIAVKPGTWNPTAVTYVVIWRRDGRAIPGAIHAAYVLTSADRGHLVSVTLIAQRPGYTSGVATSKQVRVG